jgi:site-specific recombinase XerD
VHDLAADRDAFLADLAVAGRAPGTVTLRGSHLADAMAFLAGRGCLRAPDITPEDLDAYLHHLRARRLSTATMKSMRASLLVFGAWLARHGRVLVDPALCLDERERGEPPLPEAPLSEAEVAALLAAVPRRDAHGLSRRAHLELLYGCGLRLRESIELRVSDWDPIEQTILVRGKGGHERELPVLPSAAVAVRDYLALRRTLLRGPDRGVLFLGRNGKPVVAVTFQQWISRLAHRVLGGERRVHPHLFRHSIAVHLLRGGADVRYVQQFLGHSSIETSLTYLRMVPGHLREDYDRAMPELAGIEDE